MEAVALEDRREDQQRLHLRHPGADADPGAAAEGVPGELRSPLRILGEEPVGIERLRIRPEVGPPLGDVGGEHQNRAGGDAAPREHVVHYRRAGDHPERRIEPQGLLEDHREVLQARQVLEARRPAAQHRGQLGLHPPHHVGVAGEEVEGPRQRRPGRLVAGDEEGDHLVADLAVGHRLAGLVPHREQGREHVVPLAAAPPALVDQPVDHLVELRDRAQEADVARERHPPGERHGREHPPVEDRKGGGDRLVDRLRVTGHLGAEEGLHRDLDQQAHHLALEVERLALGDLALPPLEHGRDRGVDGLHHAHQAGDVKARLQEPPLQAPLLPLAQEQPVAAERLEELEVGAPNVIPVVGLPDALDVVRMGDEVELLGAEAAQADHVAVLPRRLGQERQRVLHHLGQSAHDGVARRSGNRRATQSLQGRRPDLKGNHRKSPLVEDTNKR